VRAVVEVLLGKLVAPVAKAQVFHRPRKFRSGRSKGQQLSHHLKLLTRVPIDVNLARLSLDDDLTAA
jgi:hypothetical protein